MEQERNNFKNCSILKRKINNRDTKEKLEAHLLDYMQKHPELTPDPPPAPSGEFQLIMEELNRRGTKILLRKQLAILNHCRRLVYHLHKPFIVSMVVCVILSLTSIGASADKADKAHVSGPVQSAFHSDISVSDRMELKYVYQNFLEKDLEIEKQIFSNRTTAYKKDMMTECKRIEFTRLK